MTKPYAPAFKEKMVAGSKIEDAISVIDVAGIPGMYWYTANLGRWSNYQGFTTVLKNKNYIKRANEIILEMDRAFFYSAADRYLGVIYAKAPAIAGGDMAKSKMHFDESIKRAPGYLATRNLFAEFYATKAEDKEAFQRELNFVINSPDDVQPELVAETQAEKKKAKRMLDKMEELF